MQRHLGMVHEALKKLDHQINVEIANFGAGKRHMKFQARPATTVDHHPR